MIQRSFRIMGWICVALGICVPFAGIERLYRGLTMPWWEPVALVGIGGSVVMVGLALAFPTLGPRFAVVALSTWGALLISIGAVALLTGLPSWCWHSRMECRCTRGATRSSPGSLDAVDVQHEICEVWW